MQLRSGTDIGIDLLAKPSAVRRTVFVVKDSLKKVVTGEKRLLSETGGNDGDANGAQKSASVRGAALEEQIQSGGENKILRSKTSASIQRLNAKEVEKLQGPALNEIGKAMMESNNYLYGGSLELAALKPASLLQICSLMNFHSLIIANKRPDTVVLLLVIQGLSSVFGRGIW